MTKEQKQWLEENPHCSLVQERGVVAVKKWTDQGFLWADGRFSLDDGQTLFWHPYEKGAIRIGRHYEVV